MAPNQGFASPPLEHPEPGHPSLRDKGPALMAEACEKDDVDLVSKALAIFAEYSPDQVPQAIKDGVDLAVEERAAAVLTYLLDHGGDVKTYRPRTLYSNPPIHILEILLAHGWDINFREYPMHRRPFLWGVVSDVDLVAWCLGHGATVHPVGQEPLRDDSITRDQLHCCPVLEWAAGEGTVASFELLRSKGAPLGWRTLHSAAQAATLPYRDHGRANDESEVAESKASPKEVTEVKESPAELRENDRKDRYEVCPSKTYAERIAMVRHLVDVVGIDVNAPDQPKGHSYGHRGYTPLGCAAFEGDSLVDSRELFWFLMDRGADPEGLLVCERNFPGQYSAYVKIVEEWRARTSRSNTRSWCCIQ